MAAPKRRRNLELDGTMDKKPDLRPLLHTATHMVAGSDRHHFLSCRRQSQAVKSFQSQLFSICFSLGPPMSNPPCHAGRMKIKKSGRFQISALQWPVRHAPIARFGPARLVRHWSPSARSGRHELIGGTAEHHAAARKWCSLFAPEVVFKSGGTSGTHAAKAAEFYSRRVAHSRASFSA